MTKISTFLSTLRNDVFKLLPMKEAFNEGRDNHISEYIYSLIVTAEGALVTFKELETSKGYIYVVNNLNYLCLHESIEFSKWRKIILNCSRSLDDLSKSFGGQ